MDLFTKFYVATNSLNCNDVF